MRFTRTKYYVLIRHIAKVRLTSSFEALDQEVYDPAAVDWAGEVLPVFEILVFRENSPPRPYWLVCSAAAAKLLQYCMSDVTSTLATATSSAVAVSVVVSVIVDATAATAAAACLLFLAAGLSPQSLPATVTGCVKHTHRQSLAAHVLKEHEKSRVPRPITCLLLLGGYCNRVHHTNAITTTVGVFN